jgi:hypothetical protein
VIDLSTCDGPSPAYEFPRRMEMRQLTEDHEEDSRGDDERRDGTGERVS